MNIIKVTKQLLISSLLFGLAPTIYGDTKDAPAAGTQVDMKKAFEGAETGIIKDPQPRVRSQSQKAPKFVTVFNPATASTPIFSNIDPKVREQVLRSLMKPEIGSVALTADAGVGKSATVNALAYDIVYDNVPKKLQGYDVFFIDIGALSKGSERPGVLEGKIQEMINISREEKIIWVVDEVHSLRGQGTHEGNSNDVFQLLKPWMTAGVFKMIGMSTPEEFSAAFSGDPALQDRFSEVRIKPPSGERLVTIVTNWAKARYDVDMEPRVVQRAIQFAEEFNAIGNQPRKTTHLLQEAYSILDFEDSKEPMSIYLLMRAAISMWGISEAYFDPAAKLKLIEELPGKLKEYIVEQDFALDEIVKATEYAYAGVHDTTKPRLAFLMTGPPGTGKTETVKAYGRAMELPVKRIMMSKYATATAGDTERLKNDIYHALNKNPFTILFFDEIEKCPVPIQDALLGILDSGRFSVSRNIDTTGRNERTVAVDVSKASIFFATNAGGSEILAANNPGQKGIGFNATTGKQPLSPVALMSIMEAQGVSGPLIDRTHVIPFGTLSFEGFSEVLNIHIKHTLKEITQTTHNEFSYDARAISAMANHLSTQHYRPNMSNRRLTDILNINLRTPLAQTFLDFPDASKFELTYESFHSSDSHIVISPQSVDCERVLMRNGEKL